MRGPLSVRSVCRSDPSALSIAPEKACCVGAAGAGGRGAASAAPTGNGSIVPFTTAAYRFRFSVSIRTSSETVIVFEFA